MSFKSESVNFAVSNDHKWTNVIWLNMKLNDSIISYLQKWRVEMQIYMVQYVWYIGFQLFCGK